MLTKAQSILIGGLNRVEVPEWVRAAVFCMVGGEDRTAMQMAEYIADNMGAQKEALMNEAKRISAK